MFRRLLTRLRWADRFGDDPAGRRRADLLAVAVLMLCTWALHGHALTLGFWFDDHNHLELCRQSGFRDLAGGNRFDWTHRICHVWWAQQETGWAYFRPLTVAIRVALLSLFGLNPLPFHLVHLSLFSLSVALFYGLLRRCGWGVTTAWTAGLFFVLHPANAFTTTWLANDGPVLVGLWLVLGLWLVHASARWGHRRPAVLAGVFVCYALALLCRENGLLVGPLFVLFDAFGAGRGDAPPASWRRRSAVYAGLAVESLIYLPFRAWRLGPAPAPRSPYFHWPTEPGFVAWLPYKALNELFCLPLGLPLVPIVEVSWWQARPLTAAAALLVVIALAAVFLFPLRRSRAAWGVLAGIFLAQTPTMLAFSAPYNDYLATAGVAVLLVMWARRLRPLRPRLVGWTLASLATAYLVGLWSGAWLLHSAAAAERVARANVMDTGPAEYPRDTRLFFINLPFFAAEVGPALRNASDRSDLEVYHLTFAPELFFPKSRVVVEQEDAHTLLVRSRGEAFFAGAFGDQVQLGWFGAGRGDLTDGPVAVRPAAGPLPFRVEVVEADGQGVHALRFVFDRPLDDPGYRFFLGSSRACAGKLSFPLAGTHEEAADEDGPCPTNRDLDHLRRMQMAWRRLLYVLTAGPL